MCGVVGVLWGLGVIVFLWLVHHFVLWVCSDDEFFNCCYDYSDTHEDENDDAGSESKK